MRTARIVIASATVGALASIAASALAGSGVGGIFNLGEVNTVDAQTSLTGNVGGNSQLRVENSATGSNSFGLFGKMMAGSAAASSAGVRGVNASTDADGYGVWGVHQGSGAGVFGSSSAGTGVFGQHSSSSGGSPGVQGETSSTTSGGAGVMGRALNANAAGNTAGVRGTNTSNFFPSPGVWGSALGIGVYGTSMNGFGVVGESECCAGVRGEGSSYGVWGRSETGTGVYGESLRGTRLNGRPGVYGRGYVEDGVWAVSTQATGLYAQAPNYAAYLNGRVFVDGSLSLGWRTFANGDTTPDVRDGSLFRASNSSGTTITNFDNGRTGQQLTMRFTNSNTDVADNSSIRLSGTFSPNTDDTLQLVNDNGIWYEVGRSSN